MSNSPCGRCIRRSSWTWHDNRSALCLSPPVYGGVPRSGEGEFPPPLHCVEHLPRKRGGKELVMPSVSAGGPRLLLRRLREIMAEKASAQNRLDKLVTVIAANMVAEVCSIYLRRAGKVLELFATEGLNPAAVHSTRMKEGEGLVGLVADSAEAVNLSDAPNTSAILLSSGNGRRPLSLLPRRADRAWRAGCSACSRCKTAPRAIRRRGSRGAANRRHGAGGSRRAGRVVQRRRTRRARIACRPAAQIRRRRPVAKAWRSGASCCTSRACWSSA